jgi:hypothetical protein
VADWSLDIAIAPEAALPRVSSSINLPKKRAFGVLKTQPEYVGVIQGSDFEIWERQQRAVHAFGQVRGIHGGSRIELRFFLPPRTRILLAVFFVLYVIAALGIASNRADGLSGGDVVLVVGASLLVALLFAVAAQRQRTHLRSFIERLFVDDPRI